jgi:hypothetical protein
MARAAASRETLAISQQELTDLLERSDTRSSLVLLCIWGASTAEEVTAAIRAASAITLGESSA